MSKKQQKALELISILKSEIISYVITIALFLLSIIGSCLVSLLFLILLIPAVLTLWQSVFCSIQYETTKAELKELLEKEGRAERRSQQSEASNNENVDGTQEEEPDHWICLYNRNL